ncbi:hypothetical protein KOW79_000461 [Hemibagrus wyckioides]|uniref:Uncharacterized protein n=1 Tax=Hemibagrus wyckioides TaxID=337641 RepID=A0A9D3P6U7_9TELE|nr:hypothetical protein KOW79_000461 [Hemibagrus wyckioides]
MIKTAIYFAMLLLMMISQPLHAADPEQCTTLRDGKVRCDLPSSIIKILPDKTCNAQWIINGTSVADYQANKWEFVFPIITPTLESVTLDRCHDALIFYITCTKIDFNKNFPFLCQKGVTSSPETTGTSSSPISKASYILLTTAIAAIAYIFV